MKSFVISGTHSGCGKTTISLGLMRAFSNLGKKVRPFKIGPDYIDTGYHHLAAKEKSINLDAHLLRESEIHQIFRRGMIEKDLGIIEGVMGLYDGRGVEDTFASTAYMANLLDTGVILVLDAKGMALSAAAIIKGFQTFQGAPHILGILFNQVKSESHYKLLEEAVKIHTGLPCFGYVRPFSDISLKSRHLGLHTAYENPHFEENIELFSKHLSQTVNLTKIEEALEEKQFEEEDLMLPKSTKRLAYALDEAFHFYYEDNFRWLREQGVEVIPFSPLRDTKLPEKIDGLYFGGGYPELYKEQLSQNHSLLKEIKEKMEDGIFCYGECGGMMFLTEGYQDEKGDFYKWVGFLEGICKMTEKLQRFGYVQVQTKEGISFPAHSFHHSLCETKEMPYFTVSRRDENWEEGFCKKNTIAGYPHVYFRGAKEFGEYLIGKMK